MRAAGSTGVVGAAAAPAVEVAVGTDARAAAALAGLLALAAAAVSAWALAAVGLPAALQAAGAGLAAAAAGVAGLWWLRRSAPCPARLRWDGLDWSWAVAADAAPVAGSLHLIWDFDGWLLLRFDGSDRRRRWAALSRRHQRSRWHLLRCAVLAQGGDRAPALPPGALV